MSGISKSIEVDGFIAVETKSKQLILLKKRWCGT